MEAAYLTKFEPARATERGGGGGFIHKIAAVTHQGKRQHQGLVLRPE